ncbi:hypothetical protein JOC36_001438 [Weissella uvarum]|uniref:hypothetical protein n=1 Tax=Weissella uvarum TaxID=1479233 RepID=UPI00196116EC|nr:hypothetical protein [Weissella uvarum]MBM7617845.1 hypothetical protein [Weissella uvarum]MCM0596157.1 hypothetical protein [Weissella uvarum]
MEGYTSNYAKVVFRDAFTEEVISAENDIQVPYTYGANVDIPGNVFPAGYQSDPERSVVRLKDSGYEISVYLSPRIWQFAPIQPRDLMGIDLDKYRVELDKCSIGEFELQKAAHENKTLIALSSSDSVYAIPLVLIEGMHKQEVDPTVQPVQAPASVSDTSDVYAPKVPKNNDMDKIAQKLDKIGQQPARKVVKKRKVK